MIFTYIWVIFFLICLAISASIWFRIHYRRTNPEIGLQNLQSSPASIKEVKPSQLSNAVQSLIATAGGVYLSLIMTVSFLKINIPQVVSIEIFGYFINHPSGDLAYLTFDPLALIAIALAVIEPFVIRVAAIGKKMFKGR